MKELSVETIGKFIGLGYSLFEEEPPEEENACAYTEYMQYLERKKEADNGRNQ